LSYTKAEARTAALLRRHRAFETVDSQPAIENLIAVVEATASRIVAGYIPVRSEMSPLPAMEALAPFRRICVPVILSRAAPLGFREWLPDGELTEGALGVPIPAHDIALIPNLVIVPILAFDEEGHRLGYGGGYYDRTLQALRAAGQVSVIGLAYAAQLDPCLPRGTHDQPLDAIVTEKGVHRLTVAG
jgi:5-formyltetrahydrofolate cyclo-ligase